MRRLGLAPIVHSQRFKRRVEQKMDWSLEKLDAGVEITQLGVVRPATEAHAEEAVEALRAGKVIAVPTDTLYGFACDAWYVTLHCTPPVCLNASMSTFLFLGYWGFFRSL